MAAELEKQTNVSTELVKGHGGVFEVSLDGELLFSKKSLGRFPEPDEAEGLVRKALAG